MTSCWDPSPEKRPSMEYVVEVMRILCQFFSNEDEPLDYSKIEDVRNVLEAIICTVEGLKMIFSVSFIEL